MSDNNQNNNLQEEEEKEIFSDISSESKSSIDSQREDEDIDKRGIDRKAFVMKNGCCRDCMRAFSKTGKSCLCQVPRMERKYTLPDKGCHFCKCRGCNPVDVRKERRIELKKKLGDDNRILYKKQRILDSDDEDLKIYNKYVSLYLLVT
jgi:hypothetical protein